MCNEPAEHKVQWLGGRFNLTTEEVVYDRPHEIKCCGACGALVWDKVSKIPALASSFNIRDL